MYREFSTVLKRSALSLLVLMLLVTGSASAEPVAPSAEIDWNAKLATMSPSERLSKAAELITAMENKVGEVMIMVQYARSRKSPMKTGCVFGKLGPLMREMSGIHGIENDVVDARDAPERFTADQFKSLVAKFNKIDKLSKDAEKCDEEVAALTRGQLSSQVRFEEQPFDAVFVAKPSPIEVRPPAVSPYQLRSE